MLLIAAWAGTRMPSSWWQPSRRMSRIPNSTRRSGRSMQAARIASYVPCRRIVPAASSVANAASRVSSPSLATTDGSTRLV